MGTIMGIRRGGGSGCTLTVTGVANDTATLTKGSKTYTKTFDSSGKAVFKGLSGGTWTAGMSNGTESTSRNVNIVADYAVTLAYFSATIAVTWPAGSTCTCENGSTVLTAPDTSGSYTFTVTNTGTWTVSCTNGTENASESVSITAAEQCETVVLKYDLVLVGGGSKHEDVTGGWTSARTEYTIELTEQHLKITGAAGGLTGYVTTANFNTALLADYNAVVMTYTLATTYEVSQRDFRLEVANAGVLAATTGTLEWTDDPKTVSLDITNINAGFIRLLCGQVTEPGFVITSLKLTR